MAIVNGALMIILSTSFCLNTCFQFGGHIPRSRTDGLYGNSMFNLLRNHQHRQIYSNRKYINGCLGLGGFGGVEGWYLKGIGFLFVVMKYSQINCGDDCTYQQIYGKH